MVKSMVSGSDVPLVVNPDHIHGSLRSHPLDGSPEGTTCWMSPTRWVVYGGSLWLLNVAMVPYGQRWFMNVHDDLPIKHMQTIVMFNG